MHIPWLDVTKLQTQADVLFAQLKKEAAHADLLVEHTHSHAFKANQGALEENKVTDLVRFGVRIVKDHRVGIAYSEAASLQDLQHMVSAALVNASFADKDEHENISEDTTHWLDDLSQCPEEVIPTALHQPLFELERALLNTDEIVAVPHNGLTQVHREILVLNSHGLLAHQRNRYYGLYAYALAERINKQNATLHNKINAMSGDQWVTDRFRDFLDVESLAEKIRQETLDLLEAEPVTTGHWDVIFSTDNLASIFKVFSSIFSGKTAKDGINPLKNKLGTQIADSRLSLCDQPRSVEGLGFTPFDAEGSATKTTAIIEKGRLETFLHNRATAHYFSVKNTGHAQRSPNTTLGVGAHQLYIRAATDKESDTTINQGSYLKLTHLTGLHSGVNPISGDFSCGASGYWFKDGKIQKVVKEITVAGNFFELLKSIANIGSKVEFNASKDFSAPSIRFKDLAISGT